MANNNFQIFGKSGSNILSPYNTNSEVLNGFQPNTIINSATMNSVLKQNSLITYAIAQYIIDKNIGSSSVDMSITMTQTQVQNKIDSLFNKFSEWERLLITQPGSDHTNDYFLYSYYDNNQNERLIDSIKTSDYIWPKAEDANFAYNVDLFGSIYASDPTNGDRIKVSSSSDSTTEYEEAIVQIINARHSHETDLLSSNNISFSADGLNNILNSKVLYQHNIMFNFDVTISNVNYTGRIEFNLFNDSSSLFNSTSFILYGNDVDLVGSIYVASGYLKQGNDFCNLTNIKISRNQALGGVYFQVYGYVQNSTTEIICPLSQSNQISSFVDTVHQIIN